MTTALIADHGDSYALSVRQCRLHTRVIAWLRAYRLDQMLATGISPDSSVLLSLHAGALHSAASRKYLARAYRRLVVDAMRIPHPRGVPVPLARREIVRCQDLVEELAEMLERSEPADPRGIALASLLLRDGASPFYSPEVVDVLRPSLQEVIDKLAVAPSIDPPS